jgi:hypothetical protein
MRLAVVVPACSLAIGSAAAVEPAKPGWSAAGLVDLATYVQSQKTTGFLIIIVPSRKLIVVRTGQAAIDRDFNQQIWLAADEGRAASRIMVD